MQTAQYPRPYAQPPPPQYSLINGYAPYPSNAGLDPRLPPAGAYLPSAPSNNNKRLASAQPHPAESPAKKKQSKWTVDEDAEIIRLRGNGMKWEDISRQLPGRSAISCRLRFQNYLERRSEWDEEKKNKLARLYERFKKDMWEKIAKEMQLPWRAAEAMHWQIGEVEMAQRANVPVFHLAGGQPAPDQRADSISPTSVVSALHHQQQQPPPMPSPYQHVHSHSLPQIPMLHQSQSVSPVATRPGVNGASSPPGQPPPPHLRRRADSARSVPPAFSMTPMASRALLPPLGELPGPAPRYTLPPVVTLPDATRR